MNARDRLKIRASVDRIADALEALADDVLRAPARASRQKRTKRAKGE